MQSTLKRVLAAGVITLVVGLSSVYGATTEIGNTNAVAGEQNVELPITITVEEGEVVSEYSVRVDYDVTPLSFDGEESGFEPSVSGNSLFSTFQEVIGGKVSVSVALDPEGSWEGKFPEGTTTVGTLVFDVEEDAVVGTTDVVFGSLNEPADLTGEDGYIRILDFYNALDVDDSVTEDEGDTTIDVLTNDIDENGDDVSADATVESVDDTNTKGTVKLDQGLVSYNPNGQFEHLNVGDSEQDTFEYTGSYDHPTEGTVTDTGTVTVTINGVDDPPFVANSLANVEVHEDAADETIDLANVFSDVDNDDAGITKTAQSSNDDLVATSVDGDTLTLVFQPDANGTAEVTVTGSSNGEDVQSQFEVTVIPVNDPPSFTAGDDQAADEDAGEQTVSDWATDISAGPANEADQDVWFEVKTNNPDVFSVSPAIDSDGNLSYTPATTTEAASSDVGNGPGVASVTVILKDDGGTANGGVDKSTPAEFTITISPVNDAPEISDLQITDSADLVGGGDVTVDVTASDEESADENLQYTYVWKSGETTIKTTSDVSETTDTLAEADQDGLGDNYPISCEVTARDTDDGTTAETINTYVGNQPPAITEVAPEDDPEIDEHETQTFEITFDDTGNSPQDDGIASIVWYLNTNDQGFVQVQDEGVTSETGAASDSYTFETDQNTQLHDDSNTFAVRAEATDGQGVTNRQEWTVTVNDVNSEPSVANLSIQPKDGENDDISTSKWEEITELVAEHTVEDEDEEDFPDGEPTGDDTVVYEWKMTRKEVNDGVAFAVPDTDENPEVVTEAEVEQAIADMGGPSRGFQKGDNFKVTVTVDDGVDEADAEKTVVLGNPPWFPNFSWDSVEEGEDYYRVTLSNDEFVEIVAFNVAGTEVRTPAYLTASWNPEYLAGNAEEVPGLQPGTFTADIEHLGAQGAWEFHDGLDVEVPDYALPSAAIADAEGTFEDNTWNVQVELTSSSAYVSYKDGDDEGTLTQLSAAADGSIPTDITESLSRRITVAGEYAWDVVAVNPLAVSDIVSASRVIADEDIDEGPQNKLEDNFDWGMYPDGGPNLDQIAAEAVFAADSSGTAVIPFAWNNPDSAETVFLLVRDRQGRPVAGLDRLELPVSETGRMRYAAAIPAGRYEWYAIARNEQGYSDWSSNATFRVRTDEQEVEDVFPTIDDIAATDVTLDVAANSVEIDITGKYRNTNKVGAYVYDTSAGEVVFNYEVNVADRLVIDDLDYALESATQYVVQLLPIADDGTEGRWTNAVMAESDGGALDPDKDFDVDFVYAEDTSTLTIDFGGNEAGNFIEYEVSLVTSNGRFTVVAEVMGEDAIDSDTDSVDVDLSEYDIPEPYADAFVRARITDDDGNSTGWVEDSHPF